MWLRAKYLATAFYSLDHRATFARACRACPAFNAPSRRASPNLAPGTGCSVCVEAVSWQTIRSGPLRFRRLPSPYLWPLGHARAASNRPRRRSSSAIRTCEGPVKTVFSTELIHPRDRFDFWHDGPGGMSSITKSTPGCRIPSAPNCAPGQSVPSDLSRSRTRTWRSATPTVTWRMPTPTSCSSVANPAADRPGQDGRHVVLGPGDIALIDPALPYEGRFSDASDVLVLKVPRPLMEARLGRRGR